MPHPYKRKPRAKSVPMLVNRLIHQNVESIEEFSMLAAFVHGVANQQHYDYLVRMGNMVQVAWQAKPSDRSFHLKNNFIELCEIVLIHFQETGDFKIEINALCKMRALVTLYDDFWKRETTNLYNICGESLTKFYADLEQERAVG